MILLLLIIFMLNFYMFYKYNYSMLSLMIKQYNYYLHNDYIDNKWKKINYLLQINELKKILNFSKIFKKYSNNEYQHSKFYKDVLIDVKNSNHELFNKIIFKKLKKYKAVIYDLTTEKSLDKKIFDFCNDNQILLLVTNNIKYSNYDFKEIEQNKYLSPYNYTNGYLGGIYRLDYNKECDKKMNVSFNRFLLDFKTQYNLDDSDVCYISKNNIKNNLSFKKIELNF
jgi:hypothetical protein